MHTLERNVKINDISFQAKKLEKGEEGKKAKQVEGDNKD